MHSTPWASLTIVNLGLDPVTYYIAQLAASVGNFIIVEGIPGKTEGVDYSAYKLVDGQIIVPNETGFGLDLL